MTHTPVQLPLGVHLPDTATLETFAAGDNAQALAAATAVAREPGANCYLYGGEGLGKSHILQAVSRDAGEHDRRAAYLPLSDVCEQSPQLLAGFHSFDLLCLDEVDSIAGNRGWEEALVGLYDHTRLAGGTILAAGRRAPGKLDLTLKDLSSRLGWGAVYALHELPDEQKSDVLRARAGQRGLQMPDEVANFLLRRTTRNLASLLKILDQLDNASLAAKRRLTVPFVKQILES